MEEVWLTFTLLSFSLFFFFFFPFYKYEEHYRLGTEEQNEWYFLGRKDKKYSTGTHTNKATAAGFWKARGRDKAINSMHDLIGTRKTSVFYKGRAPNGQTSDWMMHEYRFETSESGTPQTSFKNYNLAFKKLNYPSHDLFLFIKVIFYSISYRLVLGSHGQKSKERTSLSSTLAW